MAAYKSLQARHPLLTWLVVELKEFRNTQDLLTWWPVVREGVEKVKQHARNEDWLPEDVYMDIKLGNAGLFLCMRDGEYEGFVVCKLQTGKHVAEWFVWIVYSDKCDIVSEYYDIMADIARQAGCKKVVMASPRKAWERRFKNTEWNPVMRIWEREL